MQANRSPHQQLGHPKKLYNTTIVRKEKGERRKEKGEARNGKGERRKKKEERGKGKGVAKIIRSTSLIR